MTCTVVCNSLSLFCYTTSGGSQSRKFEKQLKRGLSWLLQSVYLIIPLGLHSLSVTVKLKHRMCFLDIAFYCLDLCCWHDNMRKRVVRSAERIIGSTLPCLKHIYTTWSPWHTKQTFSNKHRQRQMFVWRCLGQIRHVQSVFVRVWWSLVSLPCFQMDNYPHSMQIIHESIATQLAHAQYQW